MARTTPIDRTVGFQANPVETGRDRRVLEILLREERARPLRFALTGGLAGLLQLGLLAALTAHGWHSLAANPVAFLLAAQVNFALSTLFTWHDRYGTRRLWRRWLLFHASIFGMAVLNMAVFAAARLHLPDLAAAALGIVAAAIGNYALGDRLVFRDRSGELGSDQDNLEKFVA